MNKKNLVRLMRAYLVLQDEIDIQTYGHRINILTLIDKERLRQQLVEVLENEKT